MQSYLKDQAGLSKADIESGTVFAPKFDANGLVTAVAIEKDTNRVLMLAHMNAEAVNLTLETGFAHYYSRSRQKIWKKGESSGELQLVQELQTDCDQDAVLIFVEQQGNGAACHTGRKSCFYRRVEVADGEAKLVSLGDEPLFDPNKVYPGHTGQ